MHTVNNLSREKIKNPLARYYETCKHLISQSYNVLVDKNTHKKMITIQQNLFQYLNALEYTYKDAHTIPHIIQDRANTHPPILESGLRSSKHLISKEVVENVAAQKRIDYKDNIHFALEPFSVSIELDLGEIKELMQKGNMLGKAAFNADDDTLSLQNDMIFIERDGIIYKLKKERIYTYGVSSVRCDLLYLVKEYPHNTKNIYDSLHTRPVIARGDIKDLYPNTTPEKSFLDT